MTDRQCSSCGGICGRGGCKRENVKPPPARKPLTDERIDQIIASNVTITDRNLYGAVYMSIREVERAHGVGVEHD